MKSKAQARHRKKNKNKRCKPKPPIGLYSSYQGSPEMKASARTALLETLESKINAEEVLKEDSVELELRELDDMILDQLPEESGKQELPTLKLPQSAPVKDTQEEEMKEEAKLLNSMKHKFLTWRGFFDKRD